MENGLRHSTLVGILAAGLGLAVPTPAPAEDAPAPLVCESKAGERQVCPGDTSAGVALMNSTGASTCLLGKTWGYDDAGVWVKDGCGGEFLLGQVAQSGAAMPARPAAEDAKASAAATPPKRAPSPPGSRRQARSPPALDAGPLRRHRQVAV